MADGRPISIFLGNFVPNSEYAVGNETFEDEVTELENGVDKLNVEEIYQFRHVVIVCLS